MTQMASVLAVATGFIGLWTLLSTLQSQRKGLIRETKLSMKELSAGGVIAGFYGTCIHMYKS